MVPTFRALAGAEHVWLLMVTFTFLHPFAFIFALYVPLGPTGEVTGGFVLTVCGHRYHDFADGFLVEFTGIMGPAGKTLCLSYLFTIRYMCLLLWFLFHLCLA